MNLNHLARLAQEKFGERLEVAALPPPRGPVPDWLQTALAAPPRAIGGDAPGGEGTVDLPANALPVVLPLAVGDIIGSEFGLNERVQARLPIPEGTGERGADALAFYLPFHFYHHSRLWGIYAKASGVQFLAEEMLDRALTDNDGRALGLALEVLIEHEQFHFACEAAAALGELAHLAPWYAPVFAEVIAVELEEALCNAASIRRARSRDARVLKGRLATWMASQPGGYGEFARYLQNRDFALGERKLASFQRYFPSDGIDDSAKAERILDAWASFSHDWPAELLWKSVAGWRARRDVPTYLVLDRPAPWLRMARKLPKFEGIQVEVHTNDHAPPHIHVFDPPGTEFGHGYTWPELEPVRPGQPQLGNKQRKRLDAYLRRHGKQVHGRLCATYGATLPAYA